MTFHEDTDSDLMLVSTYAPVLKECLKGLFLLALHEVVMRAVHCQPATFIMLVCVVYIDACSTRSTKFATACGHLCAIAIMLWQQCIVVQHQSACFGAPTIVFWLVDLIWTLTSSLYCSFIVFDYIAHAQELQLALAASIIYAIHTWTGCSTYNIGDLMVRFMLYCGVSALLMFGGQVILQTNNKYTQTRNVKWVACFVLFTAWAVLIPGLFVILSVYTHAFYRAKHMSHEATNNIGTSPESGVGNSSTSIASVHGNSQNTAQGMSNAFSHAGLNVTSLVHAPQHSSAVPSNTYCTTTLNTSKHTHSSSDAQQVVLMRQLQAAKAAAESRSE